MGASILELLARLLTERGFTVTWGNHTYPSIHLSMQEQGTYYGDLVILDGLLVYVPNHIGSSILKWDISDPIFDPEQLVDIIIRSEPQQIWRANPEDY